MDNNAARDYSEQMSKYTFRGLVDEDIPQIRTLMSKTFTKHNETFLLFGINEQDITLMLNCIDFVQLLSQGLSVGTFLKDRLISIALNIDYNACCSVYGDTNDKIDKFCEALSKYDTEYRNNHHFKDGECLFLETLATDQEFTRQHLAEINIKLSCQLAKIRGYTRFYTQAGHIGTIKSVKTLLPQHKVECKVAQIKGQQINYELISALL